MGGIVMSEVRSIPADSIEVGVREAGRSADLIALGVSLGGSGGLLTLIEQLEPVAGRSLLLVRAHAGVPLEPWM